MGSKWISSTNGKGRQAGRQAGRQKRSTQGVRWTSYRARSLSSLLHPYPGRKPHKKVVKNKLNTKRERKKKQCNASGIRGTSSVGTVPTGTAPLPAGRAGLAKPVRVGVESRGHDKKHHRGQTKCSQALAALQRNGTKKRIPFNPPPSPSSSLLNKQAPFIGLFSHVMSPEFSHTQRHVTLHSPQTVPPIHHQFMVLSRRIGAEIWPGMIARRSRMPGCCDMFCAYISSCGCNCCWGAPPNPRSESSA